MDSSERRSLLASAREHPLITGVLVTCTVTGAVLGFYWLSGDWSAVRRIAAGAFAGAGTGLLLTYPRMLD